MLSEIEKRDEALAMLAETRKNLIVTAKSVAKMLASKNGEVTSPEVVKYIKDNKLSNYIDDVDKRFMGVVFRDKGWYRVRFDNKGSHHQPISVWKLLQEGNV